MYLSVAQSIECLQASGVLETQSCIRDCYSLGDSATAVVVPGVDGETRADGGEGEKGERVMFRVTRHTPRHVRGGQRRMLTPDQSLRSAGKRMKLDDTATTEDKGLLCTIYTISLHVHTCICIYIVYVLVLYACGSTCTCI